MTVSDELRNATDAEIDDAVRFADPLALRGLLYQLTGEERVAATRINKQTGIDAASMVDETDIAWLRERAAELLRAQRDAPDGHSKADQGLAERVPRSMALAVGVDEVPPEDLQIWVEELALDPFARGHEWTSPPPAEHLAGLSVLIVGAGMGGLNVAVQLKRAGIDFTIVEKNSGVGGTWYENRYPGSRVDSPSRAYLHIFGVDFYPTHPYCPRAENERYFNWVTDTYDLRDRIVFDTEVVTMDWDAQTATWDVRAKGPEGERRWQPDVVISAVGLLSRPALPSIPGMESFAGPAFHSAWWPEDLDVSDKRVAVIGTGCSGLQLVPALALQSEHVITFQRTPQWLFDHPGYLDPYPPQINWLDRNLPLYSNFLRLRSQWLLGPYLSEPKRLIDPDFKDPHARSAVNKRLRDERVAYIESKFPGNPDLVAKMIPPHPPFSARPVQVDTNYNYYDAIQRENVTLVTDGIAEITEHGVRTTDGTEIDADVLVYATGFRANECLWPMQVNGEGGLPVQELWAKDGPRAYLGTMLPGFPNFFMIYGPNMNPYGGLGVVNHEEMATRFILQCLDHLVVGGKRTVETTESAYWRWNDELDAREARKIYRDPTARSYYTSELGRSAVNCPFTGVEMWHRLRTPDLDDLVIK
jgi:4-hydroxyacetophenone monooxygenase